MTPTFSKGKFHVPHLGLSFALHTLNCLRFFFFLWFLKLFSCFIFNGCSFNSKLSSHPDFCSKYGFQGVKQDLTSCFLICVFQEWLMQNVFPLQRCSPGLSGFLLLVYQLRYCSSSYCIHYLLFPFDDQSSPLF